MSRRRSGVLLHPTSLFNPFCVGDLGPAAHAWVDWLAEAEVSAWQLLPLSPPDEGGSPYSSRSAFACDPLLLSLSAFMSDGLLTEGELHDVKQAVQQRGGQRSDRAGARALHTPLIERAVSRWLAREGADAPALQRFCRAQRAWIEDAALFELISARQENRPWWTWPAPLRDRRPDALAKLRATHQNELTRYYVTQLLIQEQWDALKRHCATLDISLIGDMPIYVDHNSADVWSHPSLFDLIEGPQRRGEARVVAGVPPDAFSDVGQRWGNPIYRWDRMEADGYRWWVARLTRALSLTDLVRIDHFRALSAYWEIPSESPDARTGRWVEGPGQGFFDVLRAQLGPELPLIAEDLGLIDEPVRALLRSVELPGMKVLQFAFGDGPENLYLPHNHVANSVVYTGTHDNETTRGWWEGLDEGTREDVRAYIPNIEREGAAWGLTRTALASVAELAIIPLQDLLNLDNRSRMNQPGSTEGNWSWRLTDEPLSQELAQSLAQLNRLYGRGSA